MGEGGGVYNVALEILKQFFCVRDVCAIGNISSQTINVCNGAFKKETYEDAELHKNIPVRKPCVTDVLCNWLISSQIIKMCVAILDFGPHRNQCSHPNMASLGRSMQVAVLSDAVFEKGTAQAHHMAHKLSGTQTAKFAAPSHEGQGKITSPNRS